MPHNTTEQAILCDCTLKQTETHAGWSPGENSEEWWQTIPHQPSSPYLQPGPEPGNDRPHATLAARQGSWVRTVAGAQRRQGHSKGQLPGLLSSPQSVPRAGFRRRHTKHGLGTVLPSQVLHSQKIRSLNVSNNNGIIAKMAYWINGKSQVNYKEVKKDKRMNAKDAGLSGTCSLCQNACFLWNTLMIANYHKRKLGKKKKEKSTEQ